MRKKIFNSHMQCIAEALHSISDEYKDRKMFLDIGCGDGNRTLLFKDHGRTVFGVDRLVWLTDTAKQQIMFTQADFMQGCLPFEDSSFDMIFSFDVIEHLKDPRPMLKEIYRILNKEGVFIISTPNRNRLLGFFLQLFGLRRLPYYPNKNTIASDPYSAHVIEYTFSELARLLVENGFKVINSHKIYYGISGMYGIKTLFSAPFFHNIILECVKRN